MLLFDERRPPGPKGHWFYGVLLERRRDPLGLLTRARAEFGDVVALRLVRFYVYLLSHPEHVKHVLVDNNANYSKGRMAVNLKPLLGEGLLTSDGEHWKRQRRLAQPAFHRERIAGLVEVMVRRTEQMVRDWEGLARSGAGFDVAAEMMRLTLGIAGLTLFGMDPSAEAEKVREALSISMHGTNARALSLFYWPLAVPTPANLSYRGAIRTLNEIVTSIIEQRRKGATRGEDLLQMLIEARDEETGQGMSDEHLRDEVMTLFLAGHETTANALSWLWYELARNPEVERRLREELASVLGGRAPTASDLPRLGYCQRVIEEAMRVHPPAWLLIRQARGADEIGGYPIPPGRVILMSPYVIHRHPAFWEEPERFDPDRFLPERSQKRPRLAYLPFGAGQRMCIGNTFALMEMQAVIAIVLQRFRLSLVPDHPVEPEPLVTLRPKRGIQMIAANA